MGPWSGVWLDGASAKLVKDLSGNASRYFAYGDDYGGTISSPFVDFGDVLINATSPNSRIVIRSTGSAPYRIYGMDLNGFNGFCYGVALGAGSRGLVSAAVPSLCYGGPFICDTTCDTSRAYATNEACSVSAKFAPPYASSFQATICIYDNTLDSPKSIVLEGEGVLPPPFTITPQQWDFGSVLVGDTSRRKEFTISRSGERFAFLTDIQTTGAFELIETDCFDNSASSVPASKFFYGEECTAVVAFEPTRGGSTSGRLVAEWIDFGCECDGDTGEVVANLRGTGLVGGELTLPESIEVGTATVGAGPIFRAVELRNSGTSRVSFSSITVSAPFTLLSHCPTRLAAGEACTVDIGFTAPAVGSFNGTLTVVSDADDRRVAIPVHATGQLILEPVLLIAPGTVGFGERVFGTQTDSTQVTITNIGGVTATLSLASSTPDFVVGGNTCGPALEPQASCFANVAFRPIGFGRRSGSLVVTSNANNSPQNVSLGGTGCRPYVSSDRSGSDTNCAP